MPWPTRSKALALFTKSTAIANTQYVVFTVPTGKVWLVKGIVMYHTGTATRTFHLGHKRAGVVYIVGRFDTLANSTQADIVTRVYEEGDEMTIQIGTNESRIDVAVYGAQLS